MEAVAAGEGPNGLLLLVVVVAFDPDRGRFEEEVVVVVVVVVKLEDSIEVVEAGVAEDVAVVTGCLIFVNLRPAGKLG